MHRREFLIAASMSAVLPAASSAGSAAAASKAGIATAGPGDGRSTDVLAVVYDPRYLAAREFAQWHSERGARAFDTNGCIVRLWRGPLADFVNTEETRIAGLTLYSDFEMARDCARERGLGVLHEDWCRSGPVTLISWLIGA